MVPLQREASVVTPTLSKTDGICRPTIVHRDSASSDQTSTITTCETSQKRDDCTCSDGSEQHACQEGIISDSENSNLSKELPTEATSLLLSGRFKNAEHDESKCKPRTQSSPPTLETTDGGRKLLTWWFGRILLPLALIVWCCTKSVLIALVSIILIPAMAIVQGSIAILRYRCFHGNCPVPKAPSHGIVKVIDRAGKQNKSEEKTTVSVDGREGPDTIITPLRLLVLGDSLAVGVGQSSSSTPILPETVAMSLSRALGGRPVLWTCHGAPGASTGWIVREIEQFIHDSSCPSSTEMDADSYDMHMADSDERSNPNVPKIIKSVCSSLTARANEEINTGKSELEAACSDETPCDRTEADRELWKGRKQSQGDCFTLDLSDASIVRGPFDIVVILTGSNDLKSAFFPFLLSGEDAKFRAEARRRGGGYGNELTRLLQVLNQRMRRRLQTLQQSIEGVTQQVMNHFGSIDRATLRHDDSSTDHWHRNAGGGNGSVSNNGGICQPRFPLIVLPGMPARTLPIFSSPPLRWLAVPIVDMMDNHKRRLAHQHQNEVLFVEAPTTAQIKEYTEGTDEYSRQDQDEYVVLKERSITSRESRRIESEMQSYYSNPSRTGPAQLQTASKRYFDIISIDGIHPNDIGYKFWGRHIAYHIVQEWNHQQCASVEEIIR